MKIDCPKCKKNTLISVRMAHSKYSAVIRDIGYCPKCLKFFKVEIKEIKK